MFPPAINGSVQPDDELAEFDGKDVGGTWTLTITDHAVQDTGALFAWALIASLNDASEPTTPSPTSTPTRTPTPTPLPEDKELRSYDSAGGPLSIPDGDPNGVSASITVNDSGTIKDLDVEVEILHPWIGDVRIQLEHVASGQTVTLMDQPGVPAHPFGCTGVDASVRFDDEAPSPVEDQCGPGTPSINGTLRPEDELAEFDGKDMGGTWRLIVSDLEAGIVGTAVGWSLHISYNEVPDVPTRTPTETPSGPPTNTPVPTNTPSGPTNTPVPRVTATPIDVSERPTNTPIAQGTSTPVTQPDGRGNGDVTCDGETDTLDALWILWLAARMIETLPCPNGADTNLDGRVNTIDAALILQYRSGLIGSLPV